MTNWDAILNAVGTNALREFAVGDKSSYWLVNRATPSSPVNTVLRKHGVTYARRLARKALRRRGVM